MDNLTDQERIETWKANCQYSFEGIAIVDADFTFRYVNPQWLKILGVSAAEFYGKSFEDITPIEVRNADVAQARLTIEGKIPSYLMHKSFRFTDGKEVPITLLVARVPQDTTQPFSHFLSKIVKREMPMAKSGFALFTPTATSKFLDFIIKYWVAIAVASAAIAGALNEIFSMGFF